MTGTGAVVTGGAGGLGRAIAARLVARGYAVRVADRDLEGAQRVADELGAGELGASAVRLDVTDAQACDELAQQVQDSDGLALWVNNAGLLFTRKSWDHPAAEIDAMFAVNVRGLMNGTYAALAQMRALDRGHVLNVVSLAGLSAAPGETVYAATKHAALAFSTGTLQDLREEGSRGIAISSLCPDGIWTPMLFDKIDDPHAAPSWTGVMLSPERVAAQAMRLLDSRAPIRSVPAWRGGLLRAYAAAPRLAVRTTPFVLAQARKRQAAFGRKHPRP